MKILAKDEKFTEDDAIDSLLFNVVLYDPFFNFGLYI